MFKKSCQKGNFYINSEFTSSLSGNMKLQASHKMLAKARDNMRSAKEVYGDRGQEEAREKSKVCTQSHKGDKQTEVKVRHGAACL